MNTETYTVLIVAKTRRKGGACIGAITSDGHRVRLESANTGDEHARMEYRVGEVWKIEAAPHPHIIPPHVETIVVYAACVLSVYCRRMYMTRRWRCLGN